MKDCKPTKLDLFAKWGLLILLSGVLIGTATACFLKLLDLVTNLRAHNGWLLYCLPLIGFLIALFYLKLNPSLGNGNALMIETFMKEDENGSKKDIPLLLAPLIFLSTLLSHLGGGSVGREGTAVQMGASIANQFKYWFSFNHSEQRLLICIGVSAGFAGVFGTPLAASLFALEFFSFKKAKWFFILPSLIVAYLSNFVCTSWGIHHEIYQIFPFSDYSFKTFNWIGLSGIIFGLASLLFIQSSHLFSKIFAFIKMPMLRPVIGGLIFVVVVLLTGQEKMLGLGLPVIQDAFVHQQFAFDFLIKLLCTTFILNAGFKGGEVTPLFFIGAVLGSALIAFIPLPISLLAGLGLIAVFGGATHCVLTAIVLGIELFGTEYAFYFSIVCSIAYLFSGSKSIYAERPIGKIKKAIAPYFL